MSVPKELLYILDIVKNREVVEKMLDVPEGYRVVKITDEFLSGGPVIISKEKIVSEEERERCRERANEVFFDVAVKTAKRLGLA